jgi:two-component system, cell cycle sensor histidine kinase and response regulator CckA
MASPTILFVEDERLIATLLTRVLKAGGYEVLNARNGTEALALGRLHQGEIALLLCDIGLPDLPGADVALRLGELCPQVRTLFTSGYSLDVLAERRLLPPEILKDGNTFYIPKPFLPKELLDLVDSIFSIQTKVATAGIDRKGAARVSAAY